MWPDPPFNLGRSNQTFVVLRLPALDKSYPEQPVQGYLVRLRVLQPTLSPWFAFPIVLANVGRVTESTLGPLRPDAIYEFRIIAANTTTRLSPQSEGIIYPIQPTRGNTASECVLVVVRLSPVSLICRS